MGLLDFLGGLFRRGRPREWPEEPLGFLEALLGGDFSMLSGRPCTAKAVESTLDSWESALSAESRIVAAKLRSGELEPAAWLFFGDRTASTILDAYRAVLPADGGGRGALPRGGGAELLAASGALVGRLSAAIDSLPRRASRADMPGPPPPLALGLEIADGDALAFLRWTLLDARLYELRVESAAFFLALSPGLASAMGAALADPASGYAAAVLDPAREVASSLEAVAGDSELPIEGARSFPLARVLAERRLLLPGGEARLSPSRLLVCSTPRLLAARASSGYRVDLALRDLGVEETATLRCLASALGPYERGSQEWRSLVGALAARCSASIGALLGMEARASAAGPSSPDEAVAGGPVAAVAYDVSFGGARGRALLVLDAGLLGTICARLLCEGPPGRLDLASSSPALAVEALDSFLRRRAFPSYMRSLREVPPRAASVAARLPVGGRPFYAIAEDLGSRDLAAAIGKLAQRGFMLMEHRYAIFFHEAPATGSVISTMATPCDDYEALFARFPRRWDESDNARSRLRAAFGDLDGLVEAHYEAAWILYRELLADRLSLTARGESLLRASGEAFSERLQEELGRQGGLIAEGLSSMDAGAMRALPWADRARELCLSPGAPGILAPVIGARALETLRDAIDRVEARLRDGAEDAYSLWRDRSAFLDALSAR